MFWRGALVQGGVNSDAYHSVLSAAAGETRAAERPGTLATK